MTTKPSRKMTPQKQPGFPIWLSLLIVAGVVLIAVAVLSGGGGAAAPTAPQSSGQPALTANQEKIDLGNVPLGKTVSVSFELTNTGDAPLRFKEKPYIEVAAGC